MVSLLFFYRGYFRFVSYTHNKIILQSLFVEFFFSSSLYFEYIFIRRKKKKFERLPKTAVIAVNHKCGRIIFIIQEMLKLPSFIIHKLTIMLFLKKQKLIVAY